MGLAIFYDPCSRCEHRETKKMCNMCELAYLRNTHKNKLTSAAPIDEHSEKFAGKYDIEVLNNYIRNTFNKVHKQLEERDEQQVN